MARKAGCKSVASAVQVRLLPFAPVSTAQVVRRPSITASPRGNIDGELVLALGL